MAARELLLYDYRHRLFPAVKEGASAAWDGWGIDFENVTNSTAQPTPRDHYSSLFLTVNHTDDPIDDLRQFIKALNRDRRTNMRVVVADDSRSDGGSRCGVFLQDGSTGLPDKDTYTSHNTNNVQSDSTFERDATDFPIDTPSPTSAQGLSMHLYPWMMHEELTSLLWYVPTTLGSDP